MDQVLILNWPLAAASLFSAPSVSNFLPQKTQDFNLDLCLDLATETGAGENGRNFFAIAGKHFDGILV